LLEKCRDLPGLDHYAILGVERSATEAVIRAAYYRLARLYHPDRLRKPHLEDILGDLEGMFAAITEAYNTLSNAVSRAAYDHELRQAGAGGRKRDGQDRVSAARDAYLRGRKAAEAGQLYEAIRLFEVAVENDPSRPEHFHHLGVCQGQNPRWRKKAEENLLQAIKMNPSSVAGYVELARLYRKGGLERRCLEMYEQVLRWDPEHREALAETAAARDATGGSGGGSLLRGLFRKE
jgi:curved DNA-binding protein CbpA